MQELQINQGDSSANNTMTFENQIAKDKNQDTALNISLQDAKPNQMPKKRNSIMAKGTGTYQDEQIRKEFVRKVLGILSAQLVFTSIFIIIAVTKESFRKYQYDHLGLLIFFFFVDLGCLIALLCSRDLCKAVPKNYILLFLFTGSEAYIVSFLCGITEPWLVLLSGGLTATIILMLVIYAFKTGNDITVGQNFMLWLPMTVICLIIIGYQYPQYVPATILSLIIVLIFSTYVVFDIQRLTGYGYYTYDYDDYIIASLDIYIDIMVIFKELVYIISDKF